MSELIQHARTDRAVYIHIPFCHRRCPYCDFAVVDMSMDNSPIERYVAAVVAEIAMAEDWGPLHAVNLGGGTPTVLSPTQIGDIVAAVDRRFGLVAGVELSVEANPEDFTLSYADGLRAAGINRVSLGVQSFDALVLRSLGRDHTPAQATAAVANARSAGLATVNIDLIFGTTGETMESWIDTVRTAMDLGTEHLSAYALTVELGTGLSRAVAAGAPAPDNDDQADKYEHLVAVGEGLYHYEVSNWAKPGHECRYNMTTWAQGEYDGFGLGAHSHRGGVRRRNYRRLDAYLSRVEAGERPVQGSERLDDWEREKERLFLGLRLRSGVESGPAGRALLASPAGERLVAAGVISTKGSRLVVLRPLLTDAVAREVLRLGTGDLE